MNYSLQAYYFLRESIRFGHFLPKVLKGDSVLNFFIGSFTPSLIDTDKSYSVNHVTSEKYDII